MATTKPSVTTTIPTEPSRFQNLKNLENYQLIWLDQDVNQMEGNLLSQKKLRQMINQLKIFDNVEDCERYIQNLSFADQKVVLIVSGHISLVVVPRIIDFPQLTAVYIYCMDVKQNNKLCDKYKKVKGVHSEADEMLDQMEKDQRLREKVDESSAGMSIYIRTDSSGASSMQERNKMFLHLQLCIEIILRMKPVPEKSKKELLDFLREEYEGNKTQLGYINEFGHHYSPDRAIWWYTRETCLYRVLNKALRQHEFDVLIALRFFIVDLYKQLTSEHETYVPTLKEPTLRAYRGQAIKQNELNLICESINGFISMNSFLSSTTNRQKGIFYAESSTTVTDEIKRILYEFYIDSRLPNAKPFASINHLSFFPMEDEVLISLATIFRIKDVKFDKEHNMWIVKLEMCSLDDFELKNIYEHEKKWFGETPQPVQLGRVLIGVGEYEKAKNVLQQILSESEDDEEKSKCYLLLGYGAYTGDDYETALGNYFKCLELQKKAHIDDVWIGQTYSHIAETYYWKDDFNLSFEFSEKALSLIPENHDLYSSAYRIMGNACRGKGDYQTALNCFQKALKIKKEKLPKDHDDIGITYNSLGATYEKMENYSEALECYTEAVRIHRITRPKTYGSIQGNEKNVKRIREKMQRQ